MCNYFFHIFLLYYLFVNTRANIGQLVVYTVSKNLTDFWFVICASLVSSEMAITSIWATVERQMNDFNLFSVVSYFLLGFWCPLFCPFCVYLKIFNWVGHYLHRHGNSTQTLWKPTAGEIMPMCTFGSIFCGLLHWSMDALISRSKKAIYLWVVHYIVCSSFNYIWVLLCFLVPCVVLSCFI